MYKGGGKDYFTTISEPLLFRRKVQEQTEQMQVNLPVNGLSPQDDIAPPASENNLDSIIPEPQDKHE